MSTFLAPLLSLNSEHHESDWCQAALIDITPSLEADIASARAALNATPALSSVSVDVPANIRVISFDRDALGLNEDFSDEELEKAEQLLVTHGGSTPPVEVTRTLDRFATQYAEAFQIFLCRGSGGSVDAYVHCQSPHDLEIFESKAVNATQLFEALAPSCNPLEPRGVSTTKLSSIELHSVMAALRHWQTKGCVMPLEYECEGLSVREVDRLCERINRADSPLH